MFLSGVGKIVRNVIAGNVYFSSLKKDCRILEYLYFVPTQKASPVSGLLLNTVVRSQSNPLTSFNLSSLICKQRVIAFCRACFSVWKMTK